MKTTTIHRIISFFVLTVMLITSFRLDLYARSVKKWIDISLKDGDTIVYFGDSITQFGAKPGGYVSLVRETIDQTYPDKNIKVIGAGIGGNKVTDLQKRVERDVLSHKPSIVVIYVGINDVWHWTKPHPVTKAKREGTTAENYEAGLREIITKIQATNAKVILCTPSVISEKVDPKDPNYVRLEQYANIVRKVSREKGTHLIDLREKFVSYLTEHNKQGRSKGVLTFDMVHMNSAGDGFIAQHMLKALNVTTEHAYQGKKKKLDFYLCIGQSNMAGRAPLLPKDQAVVDNAYLFDFKDQWTQVSNPMNRYSTIRKEMSFQKLSPSYAFAKKMAVSQKNAVGFIVNAKGGTSVNLWQPDTHFYHEIIRRVKKAEETGTFKGVIWHQGEADYQDANYLEKLIHLITSLRKDVGNEKLPFVVGQINGIDLINKQLEMLPKKLPYTAIVSSAGLEAQDKWHFNNESVYKLGEGYAEKMLGLQ